MTPVPAPAKTVSPPHQDSFKERLARAPFAFLKKCVHYQTWAILGLTLVFICLLPFSNGFVRYYAVNPEGKVRALGALTMPNMTDRAILSWATTSITEIMTMGFGDINTRLPRQRTKFTPKGWEAYMKSFEAMKIAEAFQNSQLVLTTVPSNTPVIVVQGVNPENVYQWDVQMPIIMNYATNNNVMKKQNGTVTLSIVRVPVEDNAFGIAIQKWRID